MKPSANTRVGGAARRVLCVLATGALGFAAAADAPELPTFRQGQWSYQRVSQTAGRPMAQPVSMNKCVDPSAELRKNLEALKARNCVLSPIAHNGTEYTWKALCPVNGDALQIRAAITVESDTAFREEMRSHWGSQDSRSTLSAHRVGDCTAEVPPWLRRPRARPPPWGTVK